MLLTTLVLFGALLPDIEVGENLSPPAQVSGPWEALVAPGEIAGFSLQITTNANEKVRSLNVDTYVRKEGKRNIHGGVAETPAHSSCEPDTYTFIKSAALTNRLT